MSRFCQNCGSPLENNDYIGTKVRLCKDGRYRWRYEMPILTNPSLFLTVFKVFFFFVLAGFVIFGLLLNLFSGNWDKMLEVAVSDLIALGVLTGLSILALLVMAVMYKGKYITIFEMDENGVCHIQASEQFRQAQKMGKLNVIAGVASGNFTIAGLGLMMASRDSYDSEFAKVRRVKPRRWRNVIKVNKIVGWNQVYVTDEDFDFVYDFIKSHCVNMKN